MITIVGGEQLSALGDGRQKFDALRSGHATISSMDTVIGDNSVSYPYYRLDNAPRTGSSVVVEDYLDCVLRRLVKKLNCETTDLTNIGLFLGSSSIDYSLASSIEQVVSRSSAKNLASERVGGGCYVERLMERFAFNGPSLTYNTACTSSANALMDAASMLQGGMIDHALVFGLEISSPTTLQGFIAMQLLTHELIRPFDRTHSGMVLGETVSVVLLSREEVRPSPWHYLGGKSSTEIYSVTGANPNGDGIADVIQGALSESKTAPDELAAIKAHGTSSEMMDLAELRGMEQVFETLPAYFSLKPYIGHTLGGCGVAELVLTMDCIDAGFIPATINFDQLDNEFLQAPNRESLALTSGRFMLNYFGFGGNNTSFIIEK